MGRLDNVEEEGEKRGKEEVEENIVKGEKMK